LAALKGFPPDVDDFEVLGSFYGEAAKLVKCETIDLMVPANAEIVLKCDLMATEGWVHDEAPFGEFTGMYGGGPVQCRDVPLRPYRAEIAFECPRHRRKCHQHQPEAVRGNREPPRSIVALIGGARDTEEVLQHVRL
jgi:3-octaprenyl-4-hydroxybenzoate carboxy-lyase